MHTLHTRAASIFSSWAEEAAQTPVEPYLESLHEPIDAEVSTIWKKCWCPLLQGWFRFSVILIYFSTP